MNSNMTDYYEISDHDTVTLSASNVRDLFGRIFASAFDDIVFTISGAALKRLRAASEGWNDAWVEDVSMTASWADGNEASVFKLNPSLMEDFRAVRAAKLNGPLVF